MNKVPPKQRKTYLVLGADFIWDKYAAILHLGQTAFSGTNGFIWEVGGWGGGHVRINGAHPKLSKRERAIALEPNSGRRD